MSHTRPSTDNQADQSAGLFAPLIDNILSFNMNYTDDFTLRELRTFCELCRSAENYDEFLAQLQAIIHGDDNNISNKSYPKLQSFIFYIKLIERLRYFIILNIFSKNISDTDAINDAASLSYDDILPIIIFALQQHAKPSGELAIKLRNLLNISREIHLGLGSEKKMIFESIAALSRLQSNKVITTHLNKTRINKEGLNNWVERTIKDLPFFQLINLSKNLSQYLFEKKIITEKEKLHRDQTFETLFGEPSLEEKMLISLSKPKMEEISYLNYACKRYKNALHAACIKDASLADQYVIKQLAVTRLQQILQAHDPEAEFIAFANEFANHASILNQSNHPENIHFFKAFTRTGMIDLINANKLNSACEAFLCDTAAHLAKLLKKNSQLHDKYVHANTLQIAQINTEKETNFVLKNFIQNNTEFRVNLEKYNAVTKLKATLAVRDTNPKQALNDFKEELRNQVKPLKQIEDSRTKIFFKAIATVFTLGLTYHYFWETKGDVYVKNTKTFLSKLDKHEKKLQTEKNKREAESNCLQRNR